MTERSRDRRRIAAELARAHDGVVHRRTLDEVGISKNDVATEVAAGRWHKLGTHTVLVDGLAPCAAAYPWIAVWESGSGAVLDGVAALIVSGLQGFHSERLDVTVPAGRRVRRSAVVPGVVVHQRRCVERSSHAGIPRVAVSLAVIHAAQWAVSDRQAALLVCMPVQQRLVRTDELWSAWLGVTRSKRRAMLDVVIRDVSGGAQAISELDFARLCRTYRIPEPTRQAVMNGAHGRVYLDAFWESARLAVEIDGIQHFAGLAPVDDALRANEVSLRQIRVLRVPLLGLRLEPSRFMDQVARGLGLR